MMTVAVFNIHLEVVDREAVWWADTPAAPGLSVAAPTLKELRALIAEAAASNLGPDDAVDLQLVTEEGPSSNPAGIAAKEQPPVSRGPDARRLIAVA